MSILIAIVIAFAAIALGFIISRALKPAGKIPSSAPAVNSVMTPEEAESIVQQLEDLGYYKYAAPGDIPALREDLTESIAKHGVLSTAEVRVKPFTPLDYKYYTFDGETLFEEDGFMDMLGDMKGVFDKMGLEINVTDHIEDASPDTGLLNHSLVINGKKYIIFQHFGGYGWGEAAQRFAEIINDQLELQQKDERLYLINGANDGIAIFLTNPQFDLLYSVLKDERWKPLPVEEWCRVFKVDPEKYRNIIV